MASPTNVIRCVGQTATRREVRMRKADTVVGSQRSTSARKGFAQPFMARAAISSSAALATSSTGPTRPSEAGRPLKAHIR